MPVKFSKKNTLPVDLEADTLYLIPSTSDSELTELYMTGNTTSVIKRISTREDIEAQIGDALTNLDITVDQIIATGTPSSTTYLRGDSTWATVSGGGSKLAVNIGDGVNLVYTINHDFDTTDLIITVHYNSGDKARVLVKTETPSNSTVRITFDPTPPTTNQFRVVIMG